jgi:hypothetical protein
MALRFNLRPAIVKTWIRKRKINPRDPVVKAALGPLAWWELLEL